MLNDLQWSMVLGMMKWTPIRRVQHINVSMERLVASAQQLLLLNRLKRLQCLLELPYFGLPMQEL